MFILFYSSFSVQLSDDPSEEESEGSELAMNLQK